MTRPATRDDFCKYTFYEQNIDGVWQKKAICSLIDLQHKTEHIRSHIAEYRIIEITTKDLKSLGYEYRSGLWINAPLSIEINDEIWIIRYGTDLRYKGKIETIHTFKEIIKLINYET